MRRPVLGRMMRWLARDPRAAVSVLYGGLATLAVLAPLIAPYSPTAQNINAMLISPSAAHWLGTDDLGRDTLSRLLYGAPISLFASLLAVSIGLAIGLPVGLCAGYLGGKTDAVISRIIETLMSFPGIVLAVGITGALGIGLTNAMIAVGIVFAPEFARLIRGQTLIVKHELYVDAAKSFGAASDHDPTHSAQCVSAGADSDHDLVGRGVAGRSKPQLSRPRDPTALSELGRDAGARLRQYGGGARADVSPRHRNPSDRARFQRARRVVTKCARPPVTIRRIFWPEGVSTRVEDESFSEQSFASSRSPVTVSLASLPRTHNCVVDRFVSTFFGRLITDSAESCEAGAFGMRSSRAASRSHSWLLAMSIAARFLVEV
jgi:hypothetical protein